ncbi:zinc finger BED domain-containing protein RICESLEEPER 2-like [Gossypium australe]|uniref:Zinc finger BED domain-containing protein RICESLEEPER 2-like n=1 Tax=Gossypium australe TaxID=47621 RepID=A0A5B6VCN0_9ROSI|nr:zinc finger BED domain-containing protein RICESLEEPER 2-like [Gossypium australe]
MMVFPKLEMESVKHITTSTVRLTMFNDIIKQLQLPNKRLILDCCTWWNATYVMFSCVLEFKDIFPRYAQRDVSYKYLSSDEDWVRVEEVCSFFTLFNEVTNIISKEVFICKENCGDFDALEWWKVNNLKFRILSKIACEILSIPTTMVASKYAFSASGRVIDTYRSSLKTDTVQMLLCGFDWY